MAYSIYQRVQTQAVNIRTRKFPHCPLSALFSRTYLQFVVVLSPPPMGWGSETNWYKKFKPHVQGKHRELEKWLRAYNMRTMLMAKVMSRTVRIPKRMHKICFRLQSLDIQLLMLSWLLHWWAEFRMYLGQIWKSIDK